MATMSDWEADLEVGQFTCITCGRATDPHELDGMEECEACIPPDEAAQAKKLLLAERVNGRRQRIRSHEVSTVHTTPPARNDGEGRP